MDRPNFGVYHLSLVQAGELVAKCLWFRGELRADVPQKETYRLNDPDLSAALAGKAKGLTSKLVKAIEARTLRAASVRRDIDDQVDPDLTWVKVSTLIIWLEERGTEVGEVFYSDYLDLEDELAQRVEMFVEAERYRLSGAGGNEEQNPEVLFLTDRVLKLEAELAEAKDQLAQPTPVSERQQSAYLRIIGALLGLLLGKTPGGQCYSVFETQQAVIDTVHGHYGERAGLSKRNLEDKFSKAKRVLGADL